MIKTKAALVMFLIIVQPVVCYCQVYTSAKVTRKEYYPDGKFKSLCEYNSRGLLDGTCKTYDREGGLFLIETFKNNMQTSYKALYPNGSIHRQRTFQNGKMNGPSKGYYKSGKLKFVTNYRNGLANGISKGYYETGMLRFELTYRDGKAEGYMKQYYKNGTKRFETIYIKGKAVGAWKEYDKKGRLK